LQNLRSEQSKIAVTQNCDLCAAREYSLIENLARGSERFRKHGNLIGNCFWDNVKIDLGQR
jgi:hypothetical protein